MARSRYEVFGKTGSRKTSFCADEMAQKDGGVFEFYDLRVASGVTLRDLVYVYRIDVGELLKVVDVSA